MSLSRFAGMYNAVDFAYGCAGAGIGGLPPALIVDVAPAATGSGTITVAYGNTPLTDGNTLSPLNTNASVTVGSGTNAETVTPSAVSSPNPSAYDSTTFTASFSNLHGKNDPIASGTFGLQEAINAASVKGGTVIVSPEWAFIGGTQTILNTALGTLPANVQIMDNRTGLNLYYAAGSLTNTQTKALNSAPTTIIPAPGAGRLITINQLVLENVFLTGAFASGGVIQASYDTGVTIPATATVAATFLTSPTANQVIMVAGALASNLASAVVNKKIVLACATGDFTTGAGNLKYWVSYNIAQNLS